MEKKDMMYLVVALVLVLVIALVIKPLATGQPLKTGISVPGTTTPIAMVSTPDSVSPLINPSKTIPITTVVVTTVPTWNPNSPKDVAFVDPSKYGVSFNESHPQGTRFNESGIDSNMTTIATIASKTGNSGTTNVIYIPFPYWELVYTVEPTVVTDPKQDSGAVTPTWGQAGTSISWSGVSGSYSVVNPTFTIQVMDGDDPNRVVRTISPPGGINLDLWKGTFSDVETSKTSGNRKKTISADIKSVDPRPWTEYFYEGQRNYYFIITAQALDSYTVDIKVPSRYIGKY